jgi:hypothetical protein
MNNSFNPSDGDRDLQNIGLLLVSWEDFIKKCDLCIKIGHVSKAVQTNTKNEVHPVSYLFFCILNLLFIS